MPVIGDVRFRRGKSLKIVFILVLLASSFFYARLSFADTNWSLYYSPTQVILLTDKLSVERKLKNYQSIVISASKGVMDIDLLLSEIEYHSKHLGIQYIYYQGKNFKKGSQVGIEISGMKVDKKIADKFYSKNTAEEKWNVLMFGPFYGYKFVFDVGLTMNAQLGLFYVYRDEEIYNSQNVESKSNINKYLFPMANIGIGWSF